MAEEDEEQEEEDENKRIRPREWAHGQKYLPKQPEAADLDVSSGWDTKLKRRGKTCLRMGADILAPEGSIHPRSA